MEAIKAGRQSPPKPDYFKNSFVLIYIALGFVLAWNGKPTELAAFTVCGGVGLIFLNLDKFSEFSAGGLSGKLITLEKRVEFIEKVDQAPDGTLNNEALEKLDAYKISILDSLIMDSYKYRTFNGIHKFTKIEKEVLYEVLGQMETLGLILSSKNSDGTIIWGASPKGKIYHSVERNSEFI